MVVRKRKQPDPGLTKKSQWNRCKERCRDPSAGEPENKDDERDIP